LAKRKRQVARRKRARRAQPATNLVIPDDGEIQSSILSLHDLFQQQAKALLDRSDLSEEQKQSVLVAMNCPCCGGSGLSFTAKLRRRK
jgi:hypothetical protein